MNRLLAALSLCAIGWGSSALAAETVKDVTGLNPIVVEGIVAPRTAAEIQRLVRGHDGPVCVGGARHSQGGQIATDDCLFIDMRAMNRVLVLDAISRRITVQAGITWRQIQEAIDPLQLSLKVMQSYANFTVGGSLSVNAHGRYVGEGALVDSVESFEIVLADGSLVAASRNHNRPLFDAAIGGYGGMGVIVSATILLVPNTPVERVVRTMEVGDYHKYFISNVRDASGAVFHNADLYPPGYDRMTAVTWFATTKAPTVRQRLAPSGKPSARDRLLMEWLSDGPFGKQIREYLYDPMQYAPPRIEWRNYEASYDAAALEPQSRALKTDALQEYFVPADHFERFAAKMATILKEAHANVLNVSVRHAKPDSETMLSWAPREMFGFVLYFREGTAAAEQAAVRRWTGALIQAALSEGGTFYLPYRIVASRAQFLQAYPGAARFFALKAALDPTCKFRNRLWEAYDDACRRDPLSERRDHAR